MIEAIGAHFLDGNRNFFGKRACSMELLYFKDPLNHFGFNDAKNRVRSLKSKNNVDVWLRLDYQLGQSLPPTSDDKALAEFLSFSQHVVTDDILGQVNGVICGNEPNIEGEYRVSNTPLTPGWVARCVYGFGRPTQKTDNLYQFIKSANYKMQVFAPAIAPYSSNLSGDIYCPPPENRHMLSAWESYQYALAYYCYNNNYHAPYHEILFTAHTYSRVGPRGSLNGGILEPWSNVKESTTGAYWGSQWLDDCIYTIAQANGGASPPLLISEWNCQTEVDGFGRAIPTSECYPKGLLQEVTKYVNFKPNIKGFAVFVDQNLGGGWIGNAMSLQIPRLMDLSKDFTSIFEHGL